jgi:double-stranded uracil-DNA glycosylase
MTRIESFPPIAARDARILILGTMPGIKSLKAGQYYAHPQNQFWRLMGDLVGAGRDLPYTERLKILKNKKIAVWDVFRCCIRSGSLDSKITDEVVNDFSKFFEKHPHIAHVFFDSGKAEHAYNKIVLPQVTHLSLKYIRIPSPSPAHASIKYEQKLKAWRQILKVL